MRTREMARVQHSPAETVHVVVSFNWFGTHFTVRQLLADFINTICKCSAFSCRKRVVSFFLQLCCFQDLLSSPYLLGTNWSWVIGQLIQPGWLQRFLSQHHMSSDYLLVKVIGRFFTVVRTRSQTWTSSCEILQLIQDIGLVIVVLHVYC